MRALLDVNALLALLDVEHLDHRRIRGWLDEHSASGWATCAITQNGFARIISQPRYPSPVPIGKAIDALAAALASPRHEYWPCTASIADPVTVDRSRVLGPAQITDVYLLALATARGGRLITLDTSITTSAVRGATAANLVVL